MIGAMHVTNPLPQRYLTTDPGVGGRIKVRPEDFLVDELPLYEPEGQGEHIYLGIQKTNVAHGELMSCLRRAFKVRDHAIGFAGMKDKIGVTRQTVSVHVLDDPPSYELGHRRIDVLWTMRHRNKLRLGHLAGNRFSIRIRDVDPLKAPLALRTLRRLEHVGVPNYFGSQRFGYRCNNHVVGAALVKGDWGGALNCLLGAAGGAFPEYQRQRRELFDSGHYRQAADHWTAADRCERIACNRLAAGKSPREACLAVGDGAVSFWISALQSAIFNGVLDRRLAAGTLATLLEGDLAWKHATRGIFRVTAQELAGGTLGQRLASMEISPSGPLWGSGMMHAEGEPARIELDALEERGVEIQTLTSGPRSPEGARRPLRCTLRNAELDSGIDEHGHYIRVAFDLPRGCYATVVLREIMKTDQIETADQSTD